MALFGTDGIRGRFGEFLTTDLAERVSFAAGKLLPHRSQVIIGRDPRESGLLLERAITAGKYLISDTQHITKNNKKSKRK